ncbi:MAG: formate--tetrahydrofolate ligase, partial [Anoxybacillus ayderensis]|nr:formate--tetrahydrofolate ligase [Anoxybacillus ayderensis]
DLAHKVLEVIENTKSMYTPLYELDEPITDKIQKIARIVYDASDVSFSDKAKKQIEQFTSFGWDKLPICMAKTQYSLSDDPTKLGRPTDFTITVRELKPSIGAGFLVALTGDVMTMPGLPKQPAALQMDVDEHGNARGLF